MIRALSTEDRHPTASIERSDRVRWVHGLGWTRHLSRFDGEGLDVGQPVEVLIQGELAVVTSSVKVTDWSGPGARAQLSDVESMGRKALRHLDVLHRMVARGPVVPSHFGTLLGRADLVLEAVRQRELVLKRALEQLEGADEWAVWAQPDPRINGSTEAALERGPTIARILRQVSKDSLPLQSDPRRDGAVGWALLVERTRHKDLLGVIETHRSSFLVDGVRLDLRGPSPAFSFGPPLVHNPRRG